MNTIKKIMYASVGLAAQATEKVQEAVNVYAKKGDETAEEGKKIVDEMLKNTEATKANYEDKFNSMVEQAVSKFNFASDKNVIELERKVKSLESKLAKDKVTTVKKTAAKTRTTVKKAVVKATEEATITAKKVAKTTEK